MLPVINPQIQVRYHTSTTKHRNNSDPAVNMTSLTLVRKRMVDHESCVIPPARPSADPSFLLYINVASFI